MTSNVHIAGWTLIHFIWQGAAIAAASAALLRLTSRRSAHVRYVIACATLVLMAAAPAVTARLLWTGTRDAAASSGSTTPASAPAAHTLRSAVLAPLASKGTELRRDRGVTIAQA